MVYDEMASGGLRGGGMAHFASLFHTRAVFGIGDILYNVHKARGGILEKVVIKVIRTVISRRALGTRPIYQDTLNGLWNEWDLVPFATAKALAEAYYLKVIEDANKLAVPLGR